MDFTFNEEQTMIQDQVEQFIQKEYDWETRQELSNSDLGFGTHNWKTFAELGWLGIAVSEKNGGFGGSSIETMLIMEEFGKGLVVEPFLETVVMSAGILDRHGTDEQKNQVLNSIINKKNAFTFITVKFILPGIPIFISVLKNLVTINFT